MPSKATTSTLSTPYASSAVHPPKVSLQLPTSSLTYSSRKQKTSTDHRRSCGNESNNKHPLFSPRDRTIKTPATSGTCKPTVYRIKRAQPFLMKQKQLQIPKTARRNKPSSNLFSPPFPPHWRRQKASTEDILLLTLSSMACFEQICTNTPSWNFVSSGSSAINERVCSFGKRAKLAHRGKRRRRGVKFSSDRKRVTQRQWDA